MQYDEPLTPSDLRDDLADVRDYLGQAASILSDLQRDARGAIPAAVEPLEGLLNRVAEADAAAQALVAPYAA